MIGYAAPTPRAAADRLIAALTRHQAPTLASLALLAVAIRLAYVAAVHPWPIGDAVAYDDIARNLAIGLGFATARDTAAGPGIAWTYAFRPPGFPLLLGLTYRVFGPTPWPIWVVQALLAGLGVLLTFGLARRLGLPRAHGLAAAALVALLPDLVMYSGLLMTEALTAFLLLVLLAITFGGPRRPAWAAAAAGLVFGLLVLVRPNMVVLGPVLALVIALGRERRRRGLADAALFAGLACLPLAPWLARNYWLFQHVFFISLNGGVIFWQGNFPGATGQYYWPAASPLDGLGEYDRNQVGYRLGLEFVRAHPLEFVRLTALKFALFLDPRDWYYKFGLLGGLAVKLPGVLLPAAVNLAFMSLAAVGFLWPGGTARRSRAFWSLAAMFVLFVLVTAAVGGSGSSRYRLPWAPELAIMVPSGVVALARAALALRRPSAAGGLFPLTGPVALKCLILAILPVSWGFLFAAYRDRLA